MRKFILLPLSASLALGACQMGSESSSTTKTEEINSMSQDSLAHSDFRWETEQFADIRILRYQVPGWDKLSLQQKKLAYHLNEAGLHGRDILWDQLYRHNLAIRKAFEQIIRNYQGPQDEDWQSFLTYAKRFFFSNGLHHHYSHAKLPAPFGESYLRYLLQRTNTSLAEEALMVIFNDQDAKGVSKDADKDLLLHSAVNFYDPDISEQEAIDFYRAQMRPGDERPLSYGLNSKLVRENGQIVEKVWHLQGLYAPAIAAIIGHLEKAQAYAENAAQAKALGLLIEYYRSGDLALWDQYNIAWLEDTSSTVDYIHGFIEVYHDPLGYKGTFESIVQVKDLDASEKMAVISENIQYFEDHSPIQAEHKKASVKGVSYRMINVVGEAGATTPATPIGVNLPNANWIRSEYGSKSISLANIESAYEMAKGEGFLEEFCFTIQELERAKQYGATSSKLHTALHEVVGHASGRLEPGVGTPKETLKNYASTIEEARADLVALYFIMDAKTLDLGLIPNQEAGKAEYDAYLRNGLLLQLRRLALGEQIEEDHMRNRQLIAAWAYELAQPEGIIERKNLDGKTYFVIQDYAGLRQIFGQQLREIQRIKSQGDYAAAQRLVERYGVKVDPHLHREVLQRSEKLNIPPYAGFIQPHMQAVYQDGEISDVRLEFPTDFLEQMLYLGENYSHL